ncbi:MULTISPECIES: hypothetical protein [unclassified Sphingopyxis]|nr:MULTISPECIES: hypothetical protein [unclassified Sphingopyxis]
MSRLSKVRDALTRNGVDSAAVILAQLAIITVAEIVAISLILLIAGAGR